MRTRALTLFKVLGVCVIAIIVGAASCGKKTAVTGQVAQISTSGGETIPVVSPLEPGTTPGVAYVWGGPFWMGSLDDDPLAQPDEKPIHQVVVEGFWIQTKEVTNGQYQQCVTDGACDPPILVDVGVMTGQYGNPDYANRPVVGVNYDQAQNYCAHLGGRLPTEAEWEKAARGILGQTYPWGEDAPNCEFATFGGCSTSGALDIYEHPGLTSPYGLWGTAGDVAEWVSDWYSPTYYGISPMYYPQGPGPTGLKSVRGGSYLSDAAGIRAAAREGLDPALGYEDVGFRCVPITRQLAPMCSSLYVPFCTPSTTTTDGGTPRNPCETGEPGPQEPTTPEQVNVTGDTGCTQDNQPIILVNVGTGDASGYYVAIGDVICDCMVIPDNPGVLSCQCPGVETGVTIDLSVCQGGQAQLLASEPASNETTMSFTSRLASLKQDVPINLAPQYTATSAGQDCPDGYAYNPETYQCERIPDSNGCPEGWAVTAVTANCQPTNEGNCPPGTTFSANLQGCTPNDGGCPDQYFLTNLGTCEPDNNNPGDFCPRGYYYNRLIGCCSPLRGDNYGCPDNYTYNVRSQYCVPNTNDGCPYGYIYDPYMGCVPDYGNTPDGGSTNPNPNNYEGDCPPGTLAAVGANNCEPTGETPNGNGGCRQGECRNDAGACVPCDGGQTGNNGECPPGTATTAYSPNCTQTGDNGCAQGYYFNQRTQQCEPTNGPNSPCPPGFVFNYRMNCCTPQPGNDGSDCPGSSDGQTAELTPTEAPNVTTGQTPTEAPNVPGAGNDQQGGQGSEGPYPGAVTAGGWNPYTGNCDPIDTTGCPPGYHYNDQKVCVPDEQDGGNNNPCPPGYHAEQSQDTAVAAQIVCVPDVPEDQYGNCPPGAATTAYVPGCPADTPGDCPPPENQNATFAYYDSSSNNCIPSNNGENPQDECPPGTYFDYTLGFCVARTDDCCYEGYYYDAERGFCVPLQPGPDVPGANDGQNCPLGMTWLNQGCVPVNQQCWTLTLRIPSCYYSPCPEGQTWNELSGGCQGTCPPDQRWDFKTGQCVTGSGVDPCSKYDQTECDRNKATCSWYSYPTGGGYCYSH
jgi:formylglycine-generating enzyme required for sulfatase activity